ncbi:hypothetical protein K450DRAFT_253789 [Umbelopsis ramanniana AG]|uniref:Uncharacterized protein n=1 Tax=Umbelopsis ramanniana AG TaxID=1314678 RepID=A0AAD5E6E0_UMBRA|nr:uncharacterized protein K450DRAFT_253789 [Umbelopsis ramanniana AG]KAI8577136.1 hypothetical protein K450DRAFT_253789 [Umbelopsis ramanniana AG]
MYNRSPHLSEVPCGDFCDDTLIMVTLLKSNLSRITCVAPVFFFFIIRLYVCLLNATHHHL